MCRSFDFSLTLSNILLLLLDPFIPILGYVLDAWLISLLLSLVRFLLFLLTGPLP
jgi:hypothetical protein